MSRSGAEEPHVVQLLGVERPDSSPATRGKLPSDAPGRAGSAAAAGAPPRRAWPTAAAAEVGAGSEQTPRPLRSLAAALAKSLAIYTAPKFSSGRPS